MGEFLARDAVVATSMVCRTSAWPPTRPANRIARAEPAPSAKLRSGRRPRTWNSGAPTTLANDTRPYLSIALDPATIETMKTIKRALDPRGILNPGKMFEVFPVWKHKRLAISLPWDHK